MSETETNGTGTDATGEPEGRPRGRLRMPLPGLAAISLYLVVLAAVIVVGVVNGRHYPPLFLVLSAALITASGGLLMLFRWAWAMALAAVVPLSAYNFWLFTRLHMGASLVQGLLNLVFLLYLVRGSVLQRLR